MSDRYPADEDPIDRTYGERWGGDRTYDDADTFGPAMRGRSRRLSLGRLSLRAPGRMSFGRAVGAAINLALFSLLLVALLVGGLAVYASAQIQRVPVEGLGDGVGALNVLVVGSDSREGLTAEELLQLGTETVEGRRTDTIFLLSVAGGRAAVLSFPRDLLVTGCDGERGRINAAYARGGPSCLVQSVTSLTGIAIDHYVEVNLVGFVRIVDAVGGVPVFLEEPLVDPFAAVDLAAGCHVLDGRQAIGFVRSRMVDSDLGRIARQQRFLRQLAEEVVAPSTLVNLPRLFRVAGSAGSSLIADEGLGLIDLARLARAARGLAGAGLATYTVPANAATVGGAAVLVPDDGAAAPLFASFADGSVLDIPTAPEVQAIQPGDIEVRILNATQTDGLASRAQEVLESRGFVVTAVGNADPVPSSRVLHAPGREAAAQLVADQVPGAIVELDANIEDVILVLGPGADLAAPEPPAAPAPPPGDAPEVPVGAAPVPEGCG